MKYVIIGNGVAAARCIEGIRSLDTEGSITVISEEKHSVYSRPLISYYLEGKTDLNRMLYRSADFYDSMNCKVLYGEKAVKINEKEKTVELCSGEVLSYDRLCVATGSTPFVPPFDGIETVPEYFTFLTLDDTLSLEKALDEKSRVLIVGAGLIGLKCAEGISHRVGKVTVCDLSERILSSILDNEAAAIMQHHLEDNGISFMLGNSPACFKGNKAVMKNGEELGFDILVIAVGVRANTALVKDIGGNVNRGIKVNEHMETSVTDVYAAGDCTEGIDLTTGESKVLALLPNASMQGFTAGVNMAGGDESFTKAIAMNSIGFFGLHAMTAGTYDGEVYEEKTENTLKRLIVKDDLLKGFMLIGLNERAGIYTSLIREQTPLSSINFELMKKGATTAALSYEKRKESFGGVK